MSNSPLLAYADLLTADSDNLPNIAFSDRVASLNTYAQMIQDAVISRCNPKRLANPQTRAHELLTVYTNLRKTQLFKPAFDLLDRASGELSMGLERSLARLQDSISHDVMELEEVISHTYEANETEDSVDTSNNDDTASADTMHVVDWHSYAHALGGHEFLVDYHKQQYQYASESFNDVMHAIPKLQVYPITDISPDKLKAEVARVIAKKCGDNSTAKFNLTRLFKLVLDPYEFNRHILQLKHVCSAPDIGSHIGNLLEFVQTASTLVPVAQRMTFNVSRQTAEILQHNIDTLHELMMLDGYALLAARKNYRNAIMINYDLVNGDNLDAFTDAGGTMKDLTRHAKHYFYKDDRYQSFPPTGVPAQQILNEKDRIMQERNLNSEIYKKQRAHERLRNKMAAVRSAMSEYVINMPDNRRPSGLSCEEYLRLNNNFIDQLVNKVDLTPDYNQQSLLYDFVLQSQYFGTPLAKMHHRMGEMVVESMQGDADALPIVDFTHKMKDDIRSAASAEFAIDFVIDRFLN